MRNIHRVIINIIIVFALGSKLLSQTDSLFVGDGVRGVGSTPGTVKISLRNSSAVAGVQLSIRSDPNYLIATDVRLSERAKGIFNILEFFVTENSSLRVLAMSTNPTKIILPGKGTIFEIDFEIVTGAPNITIKQSITWLKIVGKSGQFITTFTKGGTFFDPKITAFREVTKTAGFDQLLEVSFPGATGSAWADYDSDGDQDLLYSGDFTTLLANNGDGTFTHVGEASGILTTIAQNPMFDVVNSAAWGDYDNDGDPDIIMVAGDFILLMENNGDGTFADITPGSGLKIEKGGTTSWVDFNNDGFLDIHVGNGSLFQNNGDKTFHNVTQETGVTIITNMVWVDFDNDGDLDAINDESQLRNDKGVFTNLTGTTGIVNRAGGFTSWGDYDNDQDLDLFINGNSGVSVLYRNNGNGTFSDVTSTAGVTVTESRSATWADFDNDTDIDLFVTRPTIKDDPYRLFRNNGDGTFTDIHQLANVIIGRWIPGADPGFSAAWTDFNNDGKIDLFVGNETYPDFLFENRGNGTGNHFLVLTLVGTNSNKSAIGARVTVVAGGITQIREVEGGANTSQNSLPVEFGLGQAQQVDKITIRWPSGLIESTTKAIAVDQFLTLEEGTLHTVGVAEALDSEIPKEFALFQNYPNPFNPVTTFQYQLPKAEHVTLTIYNLMGQKVRTLVNEVKQPGSYKIEWNSKRVHIKKDTSRSVLDFANDSHFRTLLEDSLREISTDKIMR